MTKTQDHILMDKLQMYSNAFRAMHGYAYLLDKDCVLIDCNDNFLHLLGLTEVPEKKLGSMYQLMSQYGLWTSEQVQLIKKTDIDAILSGEAQMNMPELPIVLDKDEVIYYQFSHIPLMDEAKKVYGLLVTFNDVTQQKQLADQVEKMKEQLQNYNAKADQINKNALPEMKRATPPRILIVEDNAIAQRAAQSILMNNDCSVEIAPTEEKFYELFKPGKYDLVFMDIGLENTTGYIMAKKLRLMEEKTGFHVPIIALTGYDAEVVQFDCDYYQMDGVITKPLTAEQVKQIIQHYIFHINMEVTGLKSASHPRPN